MAVIRIAFPDRGAIESVAEAMELTPESKRAAREIRRAKERPGRTAELTAEEMIRLEKVIDQTYPRVRTLLREKAAEARDLLRFDAEELLRRRAITRRVRAQVQEQLRGTA